MSQWGKIDRLNLQGTATVAVNASNVVFSQSQTGNVAIGYALVIANVEYTIANIANSTMLTLDVEYSGASAAAQGGLAIQQSPKNLRTYGFHANSKVAGAIYGANTVNSRNVYGVDLREANVASNKRRGIKSPGWTHYQTWVTSLGATRNRSEVLVAMSKNFNTGDIGYFDANEDNIVQDSDIIVVTQPRLVGIRTANAQFPGASYTVNAYGTQGMSVNYSWQKSPNGIVWVDVINSPYVGAVGFSGNTTANLNISNVYIFGGNTVNTYVRVVLTGNAATTVISDNVQVYVGQSQ
jgi:hypothetical protein